MIRIKREKEYPIAVAEEPLGVHLLLDGIIQLPCSAISGTYSDYGIALVMVNPNCDESDIKKSIETNSTSGKFNFGEAPDIKNLVKMRGFIVGYAQYRLAKKKHLLLKEGHWLDSWLKMEKDGRIMDVKSSKK